MEDRECKTGSMGCKGLIWGGTGKMAAKEEDYIVATAREAIRGGNWLYIYIYECEASV